MSDRDLIPTPEEFEHEHPRKKSFIARLVGRLRVKPGVGEQARRVEPPSVPAAREAMPPAPEPHPQKEAVAAQPPPPEQARPARKIVFRDDVARPPKTHRGK